MTARRFFAVPLPQELFDNNATAEYIRDIKAWSVVCPQASIKEAVIISAVGRVKQVGMQFAL